MKRFLILVLATVMVFSITACGQKKPENIPTLEAQSTVPESVKIDETGTWPENVYTDGIPRPDGVIQWSIVDSAHETCGISIRGISKKNVNHYMDQLQEAGFQKISKAEETIKGEGYISLGTLYSDGNKAISLSFSEPALMLTVSNKGIDLTKHSAFHSAHMTNIYQNSYATYDEETGIGITTELYVPKSSKIKPEFTGLNGMAVISLSDRDEYLYFGAIPDHLPAMGVSLTTGVLGKSGVKGVVTVSGTAYAENALAEGGSFVITYEVTLP